MASLGCPFGMHDFYEQIWPGRLRVLASMDWAAIVNGSLVAGNAGARVGANYLPMAELTSTRDKSVAVN